MKKQAEYIIQGNYVITDDLCTSALEIQPDSTISAPEGKYLLLTVDGVNVPAAPGFYEGDVRITVCDNFTRESLRFGERTVLN